MPDTVPLSVAPSPVFDALAGRAAEAGIWVWCRNRAGRVIGRPGTAALSGTELDPIIGTLGAASEAGKPGVWMPIGGAAWALLLPTDQREIEFLAIAWSREQAAQAAVALEIEQSAAEALACPLLTGGAAGLPCLAKLLRWICDDLAQSDQNTTTLSQFGDRLVQSYEELTALLQLAGLLRGIADPESTLTAVCHRIAEVLRFGFVALSFSADKAATAGLSQRTILAGIAPEAPSGFEALAADLLEDVRTESIGPVLTAANSAVARAAGTEAIVQPVLHDGRLLAVLIAGGKTADSDVTSGEIRFLEATAGLLGVYHENAARFDEQRRMFFGTLKGLTSAVDAKDPYTRGHSERVGWLAAQMAHALELSGAEVERYHIAGLVHDIGKIGVPEAVLQKAGRLTDEEFGFIKLHPETGHRILRDIPGLEDLLPGVLHHHEKWNGQGYPHGLAGDAIPLVARVLALADTFDAMSSDRSYRKRLSREQVLAEITRCAGTQFDPGLAMRFTALDFSGFDQMLVNESPAAAA